MSCGFASCLCRNVLGALRNPISLLRFLNFERRRQPRRRSCKRIFSWGLLEVQLLDDLICLQHLSSIHETRQALGCRTPWVDEFIWVKYHHSKHCIASRANFGHSYFVSSRNSTTPIWFMLWRAEKISARDVFLEHYAPSTVIDCNQSKCTVMIQCVWLPPLSNIKFSIKVVSKRWNASSAFAVKNVPLKRVSCPGKGNMVIEQNVVMVNYTVLSHRGETSCDIWGAHLECNLLHRFQEQSSYTMSIYKCINELPT